jgi:transcriptional regulator with XRE-family HTH domain
MRTLRNYLRVYRRRWHLTQEELAFLFGYDAESIISRFEREERVITLAVATACQTIFGVEPKEVFPALFASVEQSVVQRMYELRDRLAQSELTQGTLAKLDLLQEALSRIEAASERQRV